MTLGVENLFKLSVDESKQFWGCEGYSNCRILEKVLQVKEVLPINEILNNTTTT